MTMLYLAFIFHIHQPYYKNLLTNQTDLPWVRLHGIKDYLDMVRILERYPLIHQTFNLVPCLIDQLEDYEKHTVKDKFWEISLLPADKLSAQAQDFILTNFFSINPDKCISIHPRYYELYLKKKSGKKFTAQDYLDLQVWFNLSWFDPYFRRDIPELAKLTAKARFFTEQDKHIVLDTQLEILKQIIPAYKKFSRIRQIEVSISPYYHPILPLLYDLKIAKEPNQKILLPDIEFSYPCDLKAQIDRAMELYQNKFDTPAQGMWPSEQAVSEHILPFIIQSGINWIVTDEALLFKSLGMKQRTPELLYQPYCLKRTAGNLNIIFRDRNLSDLIGFVYYKLSADAAVSDFIKHLENIAVCFKERDILVTVAMDGENAWEYYTNDGRDFLELLYQRISDADFIKTTTITEYLSSHPAKQNIKHLSAGSWIHGEFAKWVGSPQKNKAWQYLAQARQRLAEKELTKELPPEKMSLARKQIHILEGSDWFWWYDDDPAGNFDKLFCMHLDNFYQIIQIIK